MTEKIGNEYFNNLAKEDFLRYRPAFNPIEFLGKENIKKIYNYLKDPTSCGIWTLQSEWLKFNGITEEIKPAKKEEIKKEKSRPVQNRLTSISSVLRLLLYLSRLKSGEKKFLKTIDESDILYLSSLDLDSIKTKYSDELDFFIDEIHSDNFDSTINTPGFLSTKSGVILCMSAEDEERTKSIKFISLEPQPIEKLAMLFKGIGKISDFTVTATFSPEEDVFEPYVYFLEVIYPTFYAKGKLHDLLDQSISIYKTGNYGYCVSTVGLVIEEQLTQIYETLYRTRCPSRSTLGELLELINKETTEKYSTGSKKKPDTAVQIDDIYKRINKSIEQQNQSKENELLIMRDIVTLIKEDNANTLIALKEPQKNGAPSIFPSNIRENLNEAIRYRNAISHKSRTFIGSFEAVKSIFDVTSLLLWWISERQFIDWKEDKDKILKDMIKRNNPEH